mmetsp:Transcript_24080/g.49693  ORF Transcript_24080/g.49693 Transcript_24080/m.49693 type:complete len:208 (+) Transcript_24080:2244-2867(+)
MNDWRVFSNSWYSDPLWPTIFGLCEWVTDGWTSSLAAKLFLSPLTSPFSSGDDAPASSVSGIISSRLRLLVLMVVPSTMRSRSLLLVAALSSTVDWSGADRSLALEANARFLILFAAVTKAAACSCRKEEGADAASTATSISPGAAAGENAPDVIVMMAKAPTVSRELAKQRSAELLLLTFGIMEGGIQRNGTKALTFGSWDRRFTE